MHSTYTSIVLIVVDGGQHQKKESGNGNGITEYGIRERRFQAIDLKKNVSNDNKITKQVKKYINE